MNMQLEVILSISTFLLVAIAIKLYISKRNIGKEMRDLLQRENELKSFRGYKEEVAKIREEFMESLPKAAKGIPSLWVDLNEVFDILDNSYRLFYLNCKRGKTRGYQTYRTLHAPEIANLEEKVKEGKELKYKYELLLQKYTHMIDTLRRFDALRIIEETGKEFDEIKAYLDLEQYEKLYEDVKRLIEQKEELKIVDQLVQEEDGYLELKLKVKKQLEREIATLERGRETIKIEIKDIKAEERRIKNINRKIADGTQKLKHIEKQIYEGERQIEHVKIELQGLKEKIDQQIAYAEERVKQAYQNIENEEDAPAVLRKMAKAWGEYQYLIWDKAIAYLLEKRRPITFEKADEFRTKLREFTEKVFIKYKETEYKYNYLLSLFPDLQKYIDENVVEEVDVDASDVYEDRREKYLSKEEWLQLSETEKSQLALDKYNENRRRTNAQVGRDYEEYIAYLFREQRKGCIIEMFGEQRGLKDLGRDLIVKHKGKVFIVQCKRWSADSEIREKHIMQLFGTTIEYCWDMKRRGVHPLDMVGKSVVPVFVTTAKLSDTARQFAEKLDVVVAEVPNGDYPQIKCNIGREGEKIYHLPFDQQYNRVIIEREKGEFMAWTVKEAEEKGFRRAIRYYNV